MRQLKFLGLFLVMILSTTTFVSCSDDDDDINSELATMIVGKWRITKVEQKDGSMYVLVF